MAISRGQLVKELEPGLNALFGLEYNRYENQHTEIFDTENSDRAFEEEVMLSGFAQAQTKPEGSGVTFDNAQETFTSRYTHETIALAFSITEEAIEDNLYDRLASRYTKALARSMYDNILCRIECIRIGLLSGNSKIISWRPCSEFYHKSSGLRLNASSNIGTFFKSFAYDLNCDWVL
jgi:hypothetical protein